VGKRRLLLKGRGELQQHKLSGENLSRRHGGVAVQMGRQNKRLWWAEVILGDKECAPHQQGRHFRRKLGRGGVCRP